MRRFELIDDESHKFWEIDVRQNELTVRFGRLGTAGTRRTKLWASDAAAASEAAKLIREKTSKGYVEVTVAATEEAAVSQAIGLSQLEFDTIAGLLELAVPEYEGHGSNDYFVPANDGNRSVIGATIDYGNRVLAESEIHRFGEFLERDGRVFIWDCWLMNYFAYRSRAIIATPKASAGFDEAESAVLATLLEYLAANECNFFESNSGGEDFSLSATLEHKELLIASALHGGGKARAAPIRAVKDPDDVVSAYAVDVLRFLAQRCREAVGHRPRLNVGADGRLGVFKGWISEKTLLKRAVEQDESWIPAYAKIDAERETYASGGNPFREYDYQRRKKTDVPTRPPFARDVRGNLLRYEERKRERAVVLSLFANRPEAEWHGEYDRLAAYEFWGAVVEILERGHVEFGALVKVLVNCIYLGCMEQAKYLAELLHWSLQSGNVRMDDALPLYQWCVRLCFTYFELDFEPARFAVYALRKGLAAKDECFGEPILNDLAAHWRDADLSPMSQQLIWLCDYCTHRTRYPKAEEPKTELCHWICARLPVVVLAWFRLRESLGLANPDIDHPLMKARYARLYPPRPFFTEPLLERVLARLRRDELPTLRDLNAPNIPEPKRWRLWPLSRECEPFAAVELEAQGASGFGLYAHLPKGWVERSLPEVARFVEPETGTVFCFSVYKNKGISASDWAEIILADFARSSPAVERVAARYRVPSLQWSGMAEEFRGGAEGSPDARHYMMVAGKSYWSLLTLQVIAKLEVFETRGEFYRWLIEWQLFMNDPQRFCVLSAPCQDVPGFERIAVDPSWTDAAKQFEIGMRHYQGVGTDELTKAATRDRSLAAAWFERAAEQDHGKSQFNLAVQLKNGDGVAQDLPKAIYWSKKARSRGVESARALLHKIEAKAQKAKPFWKIW